MEALPIFVRLTGQPVLLVGEGVAADAKARLIEAAGGIVVRDVVREVVRDFENGDGAQVRLVFVALDDADAARQIAAKWRARGLLVNVVDRPEYCDFTIPAIVDRSPVLLAIGTGGASATLAKALRERFEALLPATLGQLAKALYAARATVSARFPDAVQRRRFWDAALAPGGPLDPLAEHEAASQRIAALGDATEPADMLIHIALSSADPDDLTLRQLRQLSQADTIFAPPGTPPAILDRARRDATRVCCTALPNPLPPGRSIWLG